MKQTDTTDDGKLGRAFQRELVASARTLWGDALGARCNIPDEKRGKRGGYWGEKRIADLVIPAPGGRTLYIEAKATKLLRFEWRRLTDSQRDGLDMLNENGHEAWLLVLFRPQEPVDGRFVNRVFAWAAGAAVSEATAAADHGAPASVPYTALRDVRRLVKPGTVTDLMNIPLLHGIERTWDLGVLLSEETDKPAP